MSGHPPDAVLDQRRLFDGWMSVLLLRVRLDGKEVDRSLIEHPSGSAVLPYDPERGVALVGRQTRAAPLYLGHPAMLEAMGGVDEGDDPADCARREALEEAGVALGELEHVGQVWMTPSSTTERVHLFLGTYAPASRVSAGGGNAEEGETVHLEEVPLAELWRHAASGAMTDAKTFMLLQALRIRRPALFEGALP